jgi:hypothetical protein
MRGCMWHQEPSQIDEPTDIVLSTPLPCDSSQQVLADTREAHVRWEPKEEGVMRTAVSFPSVRNQGYRTSRSQEAREG